MFGFKRRARERAAKAASAWLDAMCAIEIAKDVALARGIDESRWVTQWILAKL